jgi:hypothetical protein
MLKIADTTSVVPVPVKTRLPLAAWAIAGVVTLFSMLSSVMHVTGMEQNASASLAHVVGFAKAGCDKHVVAASVGH